jgi:hypothetical protein
MTYPPQGPYGQQPPDPYQQGPYQQQPPWAVGPQGGFPMGPPPKKPRTGLIATLIIVSILVVGGGGFGLYVLINKENKDNGGGGDGGGTAREAAQTYVDELETVLNAGPRKADLAPLEPVTCGADYAKMSDQIEDSKDAPETGAEVPDGVEFGLEMKGFKETSDGATFTLALQITGLGPGDEGSDDKKMTVAKEDGAWKVCGIFEGVGGGGPPTGEDGPSQAPSGEVPPNPFPSR